jgi:hypothetical protein
MSDLIEAMRGTARRYEDTMGLTREGAIRRVEALHDALLDFADKLAALRETHHLTPKDQEPVGYLHTLHMELGQTSQLFSIENLADSDEPERTAFGKPGRDYSETYSVSVTPLYAVEKRHD